MENQNPEPNPEEKEKEVKLVDLENQPVKFPADPTPEEEEQGDE